MVNGRSPSFALGVWRVAVGLLFVFAIACSSKRFGDPPAINVGGDWRGTWESNGSAGYSGTLFLELTDNNGVIRGDITLGSSPCLTESAVTGNVSGHTLSLTAASGADEIRFTATIQTTGQNTLTGDYQISEGTCSGDTGTFTVTAVGSSDGEGGSGNEPGLGEGGRSLGGAGNNGGVGGRGGNAGLGGGAGSGGGGNLLGAPLGGTCDANQDCAAGLICLTADGTDWYGAGPSNGFCTVSCAANLAACAAYPGTVCVSGQTAAEAFCFEGCTRGNVFGKCQARPDVACTQVATNLSACTPACGSDSQCPAGRFCDPISGACTDAEPTGDPIGTQCDPTAALNTCAGGCFDFGEGFAACTALCTVGLEYAGCGLSPAEEVTGGDPVCLPLLTETDGLNDAGLCLQRCNIDADCLHPDAYCEPFTDPAARDAFQSDGLCLPDFEEPGVDAGEE